MINTITPNSSYLIETAKKEKNWIESTKKKILSSPTNWSIHIILNELTQTGNANNVMR